MEALAAQAPLAAGLPLGSPEFNRDPFATFAELREESPVHRALMPAGGDAYLVWRYADVLAAFTDERLRKLKPGESLDGRLNRAWIPPLVRPLTMRTMIDFDGPEHARLRGLVHEAFTAESVNALTKRLEELTSRLADAMLAHDSADLVRDYAAPIPSIMIAEVLGVPLEDRARFERAADRLVGARNGRLNAVPRILSFLRYIHRLIREKRARPRDDLLSMLVHAQQGRDGLTNDELVLLACGLLVAGHITTRSLIAVGVLELMQRPDLIEEIRSNPEVLPTMTDEVARFVSPLALGTDRFAHETLSIGGVTIPAGALVLLVMGSANRDPEQFDDPDSLDLARKPNRHLAFGYGPHYCLGAFLARLEGRIALQTLLERAPDLRLTVPMESLPWSAHVVTRNLEAMPVRFR